jgi:hypothetical protein
MCSRHDAHGIQGPLAFRCHSLHATRAGGTQQVLCAAILAFHRTGDQQACRCGIAIVPAVNAGKCVPVSHAVEGVASMRAGAICLMKGWRTYHMLQDVLQDLIWQVTDCWHDCKAQLATGREVVRRPLEAARCACVLPMLLSACHHGRLNLRLLTHNVMQGLHLQQTTVTRHPIMRPLPSSLSHLSSRLL